MQQRLKVNDFYQPINFTSAIQIDHLEKAFFVKDMLFVTTKDAPIILQQFSLKTKSKEKEIMLPQQGLAGVQKLGEVICLYFNNNEDLWINSGENIIALKSHFLPITTMIAHKANIYTGSADMTIRVWNPIKETLVQDPKLHALSAHTGSINCFLTVQEFLLSASSDKSVIAWKGSKLYAKRSFNSEVKILAECSESRQLAFYEQSGTISIIDSSQLVKQRRIEVNRIINQTFTQPLIGLNEMDDSFLQVVLPSKIIVGQINLGTVIAEISIGQNIEIVRSKCLRRMTLLAVSNKGLFTLTF